MDSVFEKIRLPPIRVDKRSEMFTNYGGGMGWLISHFRITSSLFFEASLGAHIFICIKIFIHMKMSLICKCEKRDLPVKG